MGAEGGILGRGGGLAHVASLAGTGGGSAPGSHSSPLGREVTFALQPRRGFLAHPAAVQGTRQPPLLQPPPDTIRWARSTLTSQNKMM